MAVIHLTRHPTATVQEAIESREQMKGLISSTILAAVQGVCETAPNDKAMVAMTLQASHVTNPDYTDYTCASST